MESSKHVIVTGAGSGIGRAIAQRLDADGYKLTLVGRRIAALAETSTSLKGSACVAPVDIGHKDEVRAAIETAVETHGPVHGLVANAGVGGANEAGEGDRFDEIVDTNLRGTYLSMRAVEPHLAGTPEAPARIVAVASVLARIGVPGYTAYCASKAGVLGLVRAMALELAPKNVCVNAIAPGWVDTQMARDGIEGMAAGMGVSFDQAHAIAMQDVPLGRMGRPEEVAGLVAFLLGPDAGNTVGATYDFNGGAWMG